MNFFQRLNPFFLRKQVDTLTAALAAAQSNYERVLSDNEILKQTYDDNPELIKNGGVEQYLASEYFGDGYSSKYTKRELKMLLDLHLLRQYNEILRENVEWSNVCKVDELRAKNEELTRDLDAFKEADNLSRKEIENLTTTTENVNELLKQRTIELKQVKADLEKTKKQLSHSKKVNDAWFNSGLGFGIYDNILLNKAFWGKKLELVELSQEDSDEQNS